MSGGPPRAVPLDIGPFRSTQQLTNHSAAGEPRATEERGASGRSAAPVLDSDLRGHEMSPWASIEDRGTSPGPLARPPLPRDLPTDPTTRSTTRTERSPWRVPR